MTLPFWPKVKAHNVESYRNLGPQSSSRKSRQTNRQTDMSSLLFAVDKLQSSIIKKAAPIITISSIHS